MRLVKPRVFWNEVRAGVSIRINASSRRSAPGFDDRVTSLLIRNALHQAPRESKRRQADDHERTRYRENRSRCKADPTVHGAIAFLSTSQSAGDSGTSRPFSTPDHSSARMPARDAASRSETLACTRRSRSSVAAVLTAYTGLRTSSMLQPRARFTKASDRSWRTGTASRRRIDRLRRLPLAGLVGLGE